MTEIIEMIVDKINIKPGSVVENDKMVGIVWKSATETKTIEWNKIVEFEKGDKILVIPIHYK